MNPARDIPVSTSARRRSRPLRQVVEFFACLALLVTLCRGFVTEGYMIETGSMAPSLLGYHKRAVCPSCGCLFAVEDSQGSGPATCPNCGLSDISMDRLLRNEGDQLLVERCAFDLHRPQRWDVVVFRNPAKPTQAYVKRLVALPGEELQIRDGDVYISGKIQVKSLPKQRGLRIPVYDNDNQPSAEDKQWRPRWLPDQNSKRWQVRGTTFFYDGLSDRKSTAGTPSELEWVRYRHWVRQSPGQATSVPLERLPATASLPAAPQDFLKFDAQKKLLVCQGALSEEFRDRLLTQDSSPEFQQAINDLYEASHIAPITDGYGYNRPQPGDASYEVRDLLLAFSVHIEQGAGQFQVGITDGRHDLNCIFDVADKQVRLTDATSGKVLQSGQLPQRMLEDFVELEVSLMDHQALIAVNGRLVLDPWQAPEEATAAGGTSGKNRGSTPWRPVRFGARDLNVEVSHLRLFRDVFYTPGTGRRGADTPYQLQADEYFVLGDNSPVSRDSRSWADGDVLKEEMFIGRPFLVHLPSIRKRLLIGQRKTEIRVPDLSRIRYIP